MFAMPYRQAIAPLRASLKIHTEATMDKIRRKSIHITGYLEALMIKELGEYVGYLTPSSPYERGAQLSLTFHESLDVAQVTISFHLHPHPHKNSNQVTIFIPPPPLFPIE